MPDSDENLPLSSNDSQSTESRMRRALGLQGPARAAPQQRADQARPRHRFVQDGGVPVVVLNSRSDNDPTASFKARVAELEAALDAERNAHGATRRAMQEAQASAQALQTRLVHAEFAHGEALAAERRARKDVEDSLQAQLALQVEPSIEPIVTESALVVVSSIPKKAVRKTMRMPRASKVAEPQPVKWWLPTFREKVR
jgi:hypothetical protein